MTDSKVKHDYHLVDPSAWPFVGSLAALKQSRTLEVALQQLYAQQVA